MMTRSITIAGNPQNIQATLYFDSRSNADKPLAPGSEPHTFMLEDDYKQKIVISANAVILADIVTDVSEMLRANGELEICKMKSAKKHEERVMADPLLKVWLMQKQI